MAKYIGRSMFVGAQKQMNGYWWVTHGHQIPNVIDAETNEH